MTSSMFSLIKTILPPRHKLNSFKLLNISKKRLFTKTDYGITLLLFKGKNGSQHMSQAQLPQEQTFKGKTKIKTFFTAALCSSLLFSGCADNSTAQTTNKHIETTSADTTLKSGIDLSNIDKSVRPQDNFYRYVNGGWIKRTEIPADKTSIGAFYDLRDEADDNVKKIIEDLAAREYLVPGSDEQKVGDLFNSYLDQATRNNLGLTPIESILAEVQQLQTTDQLISFFAKHQAKGITTPIYLYVSVDAKDSEKLLVWYQFGLLPYPHTSPRAIKCLSLWKLQKHRHWWKVIRVRQLGCIFVG